VSQSSLVSSHVLACSAETCSWPRARTVSVSGIRGGGDATTSAR
jgi:hypothetical protein